MFKKKITFSLILLPASLAVLALLALYFFPLERSVNIPHPVFEEIYSATTDIRKGIRKVDYAFYEALYRSGTDEKDVLFLNVRPMHQDGHIWDFTEISIRCKDYHSALNLEKIIVRGLTAIGPEVRLEKDKASGKRIIRHVFSKGCYTHKIVLTFDSRKPPDKDVLPKIAIIIDDLGYDTKLASSFFALDLPLSFSVLPFAPFTGHIVRKAREKGFEVILHLPMEPKRYPSVKPGPGALFLAMDESEIKRILDNDLREIQGARGVNNHMGSSFTENRDKMLFVLKELKKRNLYYVDSRTTGSSVGFRLAGNLGLPAASRSVFLDNDLDPRAIRIQMERLLSMARRTGVAIGIGHPHTQTLEILKEFCSGKKMDVQIVSVSELVS